MQAIQKISAFLILMATFVGIYLFLSYMDMDSSRVFALMLLLSPVWMPLITFFLFYDKWMDYVRAHFNAAAGRTTIEIILPQEIFKSPLAMELVLNQMYQTAGADNHVQSYWDGKNPPVFALELISTEGEVRFCINTQKKFKDMIEAQLYAQYPGIEVRELDIDYTAEIPEKNEGYSAFAFHFKLKKPDPYPIKTYVDYGLDSNPKEEEKIDPISVTLESLGQLGPGEHMWIQFLIKANRGYDFKAGYLSSKDDWKGDVAKEIEKVIADAKKRGGDENGPAMLTDGEKDKIKAMERSVSKYAFNTYIRSIYVAKEDNFNGGNIGNMGSALRPSDDINRNLIGVNWRTDTDWPWFQDRGSKKTNKWKKEEVEDYKNRAYTERHLKDTGSILTTEELATLFHLPGTVVQTPNVRRIGSQRSEAPGNLPI